MSDEVTASITHERSLHSRVEHAFATYTGRIGEWWDPRYTANAGTLQSVAHGPQHPSEVAVEFVAAGRPGEGGCTMRFAHGGWTAANAEARKKFGDWPVMLDRFAALADNR
jgi:hypothetical protein